MITDFPSVSISGAKTLSRARVLWKDGVLRMFTKEGIVGEVYTDVPVLIKRFPSHQWFAETDHGDIMMKAKCSCGGWRSMTKIPAEILWEQ